jgi:hypothetical protein
MKGKLLTLWLALILSASIISGCGVAPGVVAEADDLLQRSGNAVTKDISTYGRLVSLGDP